jgi:hypothetical protein
VPPLSFRNDLDAAVDDLDGRLIVDRVCGVADVSNPSLGAGHRVLGHGLVSEVREDREVDETKSSVAR